MALFFPLFYCWWVISVFYVSAIHNSFTYTCLMFFLTWWTHRYRITEGVNLPFRVLPTIKELGRTRMEVNVKVCNHTFWNWYIWKFMVLLLGYLYQYFRLKVSLEQKCLLLELSSKFLSQNKQRKQVSKSHQVEQSIMLLLIAWFGSKFFSSLICAYLMYSTLIL